MEDQKTFKERNLATAQKTMESLLAEKKKRERDLDLLRISEPKLLKELTNLKENIARMHRDMQVSYSIVFPYSYIYAYFSSCFTLSILFLCVPILFPSYFVPSPYLHS